MDDQDFFSKMAKKIQWKNREGILADPSSNRQHIVAHYKWLCDSKHWYLYASPKFYIKDLANRCWNYGNT